MERSLKTFLILFIALGIVSVLCLGLIYIMAGDQLIEFGSDTLLRIRLSLREDDLNASAGTNEDFRRFAIDQGDTPPIIGANLQTAGLITDSDLFVDYVQVENIDVQLEAGLYFLQDTMSIKEIAHALTDSRYSAITFRILPGWRIEEVAAAIDVNPLFGFSGQDFLDVVSRGVILNSTFPDLVGLPVGASLEGFLYPDTYSLAPDVTAIELRDLLLDAFVTNLGTQLIQQANEQQLSIYDVVILASIVEREALHDDEKPLIASVYRNRITEGMKLDADPTVQYPLGGEGNWWPRITQADYRGVISEYNTYLVDGLPPGPISIPDIASIRAAISPEPSSYFFFRADCRSDGYHSFATTYAEHLANGC